MEGLVVVVSCVCSACRVRMQLPEGGRPVRCHCVGCRKFHMSAFAALLPVPSLAALADGGSPAAQSHADQCGALGPVERIFCAECHSTLATRQVATGASFLALGSVDDASA